ncbi:hypothetical protein LEP1GSC018_1629 [Leptospira kirschneri str. 2008720114]|uniref:Uncharacterized protein n=1 Tax=Leptospira kirschneri serovar Bulgarica str. Nikolaevo TaxID=1240687 RepID=M6EY14_9LEPT|nr:hypothetical protein LEP1GSC018_1629 [Leptospira kirschneri str. 2008720114]EMJ91778.1 hypothetical protein LEP1GSC198_1365 [Leptospira kirschneri str. JB]EMK20975.1 hypothetical protein LEP1GSC008_4564 [Leptospira kirschneri serovar Bulgarica str. Nikolaevo]
MNLHSQDSRTFIREFKSFLKLESFSEAMDIQNRKIDKDINLIIFLQFLNLLLLLQI